MIENILVAVEGSLESLMTAKYAICLSKLLNARLTVVYVVDEKTLKDLLKSRIFVEVEAMEYERDLVEQGETFLVRIKALAESKKVQVETQVLRGVVNEEITRKAGDLQACLLVMGEPRHKMSRVDTYYDEGEKILRGVPCPVVIAKNAEMIEKVFKELK